MLHNILRESLHQTGKMKVIIRPFVLAYLPGYDRWVDFPITKDYTKSIAGNFQGRKISQSKGKQEVCRETLWLV